MEKSLNQIINIIQRFVEAYPLINSFEFGTQSQINSFIQNNDNLPFLYVTPISINLKKNIQAYRLEFGIYNSRSKDQDNLIDVWSDTAQILKDIRQYLIDVFVVEGVWSLREDYTVMRPFVNATNDWMSGWKMELDIESLLLESDCLVPLSPMSLPKLPNFYKQAKLLLTFRQINPEADTVFRVVRGSDFAEMDIKFKDGWANFKQIEDFSQGGEVRLVGNTGQGIGYTFTQTVYSRCAGILDENGNWYFDRFGNKGFKFGLNSNGYHTIGNVYSLANVNQFRLSLNNNLVFSHIMTSDISNFQTFYGKSSPDGTGNGEDGTGTITHRIAYKYLIRYSDNRSLLWRTNGEMNSIGVDEFDTIILDRENYTFSSNTYETSISSWEGTGGGVSQGNADGTRPFEIGSRTQRTTYNNRFNPSLGIITELIGWENLDVNEDVRDKIKNDKRNNYNYGI